MKTIKRAQVGFSLIEILVSVLVLAVGLLGVAALQTQGMQFSTSAIYRTQAAQMGYEIIDRVRANKATDYDITMGTAPPGVINCTASAANCNATQMRNFDLAEWKCALGKHKANGACSTLVSNGSLLELNSTLPEGDGSIDVTGDTITVTIQWADTRELDVAGDPVLETFVVRSKL